MRSLLIAAASVCGSLLTSAGLWVVLGVDADRTVWCEVVDRGLVRTNASEAAVNTVIENVMQSDRLAAEAPCDKLNACCFEQSLDVWFSRPDLFGEREERARRLVREQLDARGNRLRITQLHGEEMPTLIFVEHETAAGEATNPAVAERIADSIERRSRGSR